MAIRPCQKKGAIFHVQTYQEILSLNSKIQKKVDVGSCNADDIISAKAIEKCGKTSLNII